MSTSIHAVFNVVFGNVYFVIVNFNILGRKMRFSESTQNFLSEKSIFGHLVSFFSMYEFFQGGGGIYLLVHLSKSILTKTWAKSYLIFRKNTDFGNFRPPGSTFKVDFLNVQAKFRKILRQFPAGGC